MQQVRRGDIYYADLSPVIGSEQGGKRPVLILQINAGNIFGPTTIVCPLTKSETKHQIPTHVFVPKSYGVKYDSIVLLEQVRTIDKKRLLGHKVSHIEEDDPLWYSINKAIMISFSLIDPGADMTVDREGYLRSNYHIPHNRYLKENEEKPA